MQLIFLLEQVLNGLLVGAYYLLIALGLSLIFSLGGIVNLAHGGFYAIGAYLAVAARAAHRLRRRASSPRRCWSALLGIVVERVFFRRFYRSDPILSLLLTFGLAMVIEQSLRMIFGAAPLPFSIPPELRGQVFVGDFIYPRYRLDASSASRSRPSPRPGSSSTAPPSAAWCAPGVQNPDMVGALGISLQPYMTAVAALGIGLAGLAGVLLAPISGVHPAMGAEILTAAFVVVVIGGLGSFWGVIAAAALVGVVRGRHDLRQPVLRRGVDVSADGARPAGPAARPPRRAHPEIRVDDAPAIMRLC